MFKLPAIFKKSPRKYTHWDVRILAYIMETKSWQEYERLESRGQKESKYYSHFPELSISMRNAAALCQAGVLYRNRHLENDADLANAITTLKD